MLAVLRHNGPLSVIWVLYFVCKFWSFLSKRFFFFLVTEGGARASSAPPLDPPLIHPCVNDVNDYCFSVDEGATENIFRLQRLELCGGRWFDYYLEL